MASLRRALLPLAIAILPAAAAGQVNVSTDLDAAFEARHRALQGARVEIYEEHRDARGRWIRATSYTATIDLPSERHETFTVEEPPEPGYEALVDPWERAGIVRAKGQLWLEVRDGKERLNVGRSQRGWDGLLVAESKADRHSSRRTPLRSVSLLDMSWFVDVLPRLEFVGEFEGGRWLFLSNPYREGGARALVVRTGAPPARQWLGYEEFSVDADAEPRLRAGQFGIDEVRRIWRSEYEIVECVVFRGVRMPSHVRANLATGAKLEHWIRYAEWERDPRAFDPRRWDDLEGDVHVRIEVEEPRVASAAGRAPERAKRALWPLLFAALPIGVFAFARRRPALRWISGGLAALFATIALVDLSAWPRDVAPEARGSSAAAEVVTPTGPRAATTPVTGARAPAPESTPEPAVAVQSRAPAAALGRIAGVVVDEHGIAVPHAELALFGGLENDRRVREATDAAGRFDLGQHRLGAVQELTAHTKRHAPTQRTIVVGDESADLSIVLARGHAVTLRLRGPAPEDHVEIDIVGKTGVHHRFFSVVEIRSRTDPENLSMPALADGSYHFVVRVDGRKVVDRTVDVRGDVDLDIDTKRPARSLVVHVRDAEDRPIAMAHARLRGERSDEAEALPDDSGALRIAVESEGPFDLVVGAFGYESREVEVASVHDTTVVRLAPLASVPITFTLAGAGHPIEGAVVTVEPRVFGRREPTIAPAPSGSSAWTFERPARDTELVFEVTVGDVRTSSSIRVHPPKGRPFALFGLLLEVPAGEAVMLDPRDQRRLAPGLALLLDCTPPEVPHLRAPGTVEVVADASWRGDLEIVSRAGTEVAPRTIARARDGTFRIDGLMPGWWFGRLDGVGISFDAFAGARYDLPTRSGECALDLPVRLDVGSLSVRFRRPGEALVLSVSGDGSGSSWRHAEFDAPVCYQATVDGMPFAFVSEKPDGSAFARALRAARPFRLEVTGSSDPRIWIAPEAEATFVEGTRLSPWRAHEVRSGAVLLFGAEGEHCRVRSAMAGGARECRVVLGRTRALEF